MPSTEGDQSQTYFQPEWYKIETSFQQDRLRIFMAFSDLIVGDISTYPTDKHIRVRIETDLKERRYLLNELKPTDILDHLVGMLRDDWLKQDSHARKDLKCLLPRFTREGIDSRRED